MRILAELLLLSFVGLGVWGAYKLLTSKPTNNKKENE